MFLHFVQRFQKPVRTVSGLRRIYMAADWTRHDSVYSVTQPAHSADDLCVSHFVALLIFPSLRQQCRYAIYVITYPLSGVTFLHRSKPAWFLNSKFPINQGERCNVELISSRRTAAITENDHNGELSGCAESRFPLPILLLPDFLCQKTSRSPLQWQVMKKTILFE